MAGKRSIAIRVLGQEIRIRTDAHPSELQRVASLVDETMGRLRDRTGAVDSRELAMMTAVNLARALLVERAGRHSESALAPRLRELTERVETLLQDDPPPA
ncbi:MAG: cell division protein ZapA [Deltaproteobacteria bacterium]|nr:cell division protein ZapA [Deltaproteobacteria bacterium]